MIACQYRTHSRGLGVNRSPVDIIQDIIVIISLSCHMESRYICLHWVYTSSPDEARTQNYLSDAEPYLRL